MKSVGWFENINGILIGRTRGGKAFGDFDLKYALEKSLNSLNIPVIYDADIGHVAPQFTLVNGSMSNVEYNEGKFKIIQEFI